jgi:adenylate cyclase ExoY
MVGKGAQPVVHHATDAGNPVTEDAANYPVTFASPCELDGFGELCVVESQQQMLEFIRAAKDCSYHVRLNPLWEGGLANVTRASFTRARDAFKS